MYSSKIITRIHIQLVCMMMDFYEFSQPLLVFSWFGVFAGVDKYDGSGVFIDDFRGMLAG